MVDETIFEAVDVFKTIRILKLRGKKVYNLSEMDRNIQDNGSIQIFIDDMGNLTKTYFTLLRNLEGDLCLRLREPLREGTLIKVFYSIKRPVRKVVFDTTTTIGDKYKNLIKLKQGKYGLETNFDIISETSTSKDIMTEDGLFLTVSKNDSASTISEKIRGLREEIKCLKKDKNSCT